MATVSEVAPSAAEVRTRFPSGAAVAALIAALVGLFVLAIVNIYSDMSTAFADAIKLNAGIGPYSGKEVFWLGSWAASWVVLHLALRKQQVNVRRWFGVFLVGMLIATLLMWPPVFEAIADALKGG